MRGFLNLYGQTEAIVSGLPRELHAVDGPDAADRLRSVGFPFPGVQVRIVGEDGRDAPVGGAGEIVLRSDSRFRGYWQDQAATLTILRDGWCHTGGIGRFDAAACCTWWTAKGRHHHRRRERVLAGGGGRGQRARGGGGLRRGRNTGRPLGRGCLCRCGAAFGRNPHAGRGSGFRARPTGRVQDAATPGHRRRPADLGQRQSRQEAAAR